MKKITIAARISEQLDRDLRALAAATGRSKSWLVAAALKSYVEAEKAFVEAVEQGIAAANEGRLVDHDAVVAELEPSLSVEMKIRCSTRASVSDYVRER